MRGGAAHLVIAARLPASAVLALALARPLMVAEGVGERLCQYMMTDNGDGCVYTFVSSPYGWRPRRELVLSYATPPPPSPSSTPCRPYTPAGASSPTHLLLELAALGTLQTPVPPLLCVGEQRLTTHAPRALAMRHAPTHTHKHLGFAGKGTCAGMRGQADKDPTIACRHTHTHTHTHAHTHTHPHAHTCSTAAGGWLMRPSERTLSTPTSATSASFTNERHAGSTLHTHTHPCVHSEGQAAWSHTHTQTHTDKDTHAPVALSALDGLPALPVGLGFD
jgi:hypothetical protein